MKTTKRILAAMLATLMAVMIIPTGASARELNGDTNKNGTVEVAMTISESVDDFYTTASGKQLIVEKVSVPYFDLALYGLEHYYYNPDCYTGTSQAPGTPETADGIVTLMHAFIYATEMFMCELPESKLGQGYDGNEDGEADIFEYVSWSQGAGSSFMNFWNGSTNMNYFVDYKYPLGKPGWGSTSDQIIAVDGTAINFHLIKDSGVMGSGYAFFETEDGTRDNITVTQGETLELTLKRTTGGYGGETTHVVYPDRDVYYINAEEYDGQPLEEWEMFGTSDENGKVTVPNTLEAGKYYISSMGDIIGASEQGPAGCILNVKKSNETVNYGDANGDGKVNSTDAVLVLQYEAGILGDVEFDETAADVNDDGKVNSTDSVLILQFEAKLITEF
ncbi:MAG: dockerin type I repeat-containing protein [Eubacteriaceae bacterium]|nr:dockerin type I repeat-containing protein [Eubacteriaceae bacterium]